MGNGGTPLMAFIFKMEHRKKTPNKIPDSFSVLVCSKECFLFCFYGWVQPESRRHDHHGA